MLKQNVGPIDRALRVVLGAGLLAYVAFGSGTARWFGLIGLVPLLTAAIGSCPLYTVLGMNTCPRTPGNAR